MKNTSNRALFLARELSGYLIGCLQNAIERNSDLYIKVLYWPVNHEAPFEFEQSKGRLEFIPSLQLSDAHFNELMDQWQPSIWIVSGWADKKYMKWVRQYSAIPKVIAFDTQWRSNLKFRLGAFWLYCRSLRFFMGAWVPGKRQAHLASQFRFSSDRIVQGFYVADASAFKSSKPSRTNNTHLKILFVNRLVKEKGFPQVLEYLVQKIDEGKLPWSITVVGTGPFLNLCPRREYIEYKGFVQPRDLGIIFSNHDVYVLASLYEPWGVSLHEAAMCGLPLVVSNEVGAGDAFVKHGENGFVFASGDYHQMFLSLEKLSSWSSEEKERSFLKSIEMAQQINQDTWSNQLVNWIKRAELCAV